MKPVNGETTESDHMGIFAMIFGIFQEQRQGRGKIRFVFHPFFILFPSCQNPGVFDLRRLHRGGNKG